MTSSISITSRPIVISMASVLRKHESSPNIKCKTNALLFYFIFLIFYMLIKLI
jgi:hypothetical protein